MLSSIDWQDVDDDVGDQVFVVVVITRRITFEAKCWLGCERRKGHGPCSGRVVIAVRITGQVLVGW